MHRDTIFCFDQEARKDPFRQLVLNRPPKPSVSIRGHEVKDLYSVFWQFALTSSHPVAANANSATSANTHLREIPAARLRDALMDVSLG
jgi:hypothetical protein